MVGGNGWSFVTIEVGERELGYLLCFQPKSKAQCEVPKLKRRRQDFGFVH